MSVSVRVRHVESVSSAEESLELHGEVETVVRNCLLR